MHMMLRPEVVYPSSDGKRMAENTLQGKWIFTIFGNLTAVFRDRADVFLAMDNLWYPVKDHPEIRTAPDVYAVFGRPKGHRGSYIQHLEDDVPLTVAFEILSPGNTVMEMDEKLDFYDQYGVEEYYLYDPDLNRLSGWVRKGEAFRKVRPIDGHVSPRLGIRFNLSGPELVIYRPDGSPFITFEELDAQMMETRKRLDQADQRAEQADQRAEQADQRAEQADQRAEQADKRAEQALLLASRLRELSRKVRQGQATAEELAELERLEQEPSRPG